LKFQKIQVANFGSTRSSAISQFSSPESQISNLKLLCGCTAQGAEKYPAKQKRRPELLGRLIILIFDLGEAFEFQFG
jgi:hypothetical protein